MQYSAQRPERRGCSLNAGLSEALESVGVDKHFSDIIALYKSPGDSDAVGLGETWDPAFLMRVLMMDLVCRPHFE